MVCWKACQLYSNNHSAIGASCCDLDCVNPNEKSTRTKTHVLMNGFVVFHNTDVYTLEAFVISSSPDSCESRIEDVMSGRCTGAKAASQMQTQSGFKARRIHRSILDMPACLPCRPQSRRGAAARPSRPSATRRRRTCPSACPAWSRRL